MDSLTQHTWNGCAVLESKCYGVTLRTCHSLIAQFLLLLIVVVTVENELLDTGVCKQTLGKPEYLRE